MDYKRKYIKYKNKYLSLKQEMTGGGASKMPDDFIHVRSITKAVIGILYYLNEDENPREKNLLNDNTIGDALNMNTRLKLNNYFHFDEFMNNVDSNSDLLKYSTEKLNNKDYVTRLDVPSFEYNDLMYQVLASNLTDAAKKLAEFMGEPVNEDMKEYVYFTNKDGKEYSGFFKEGNGWKWHHTKDGQALGPNGIRMTKDFALRFGDKVRDIVMEKSKENRQTIPPYKDYEWSHNSTNVLKYYWNGWWISDKCAYAIGFKYQYIALTPNGTKLQLYHEPNSEEEMIKSYEEGGALYDKKKFINNIETSLND